MLLIQCRLEIRLLFSGGSQLALHNLQVQASLNRAYLEIYDTLLVQKVRYLLRLEETSAKLQTWRTEHSSFEWNKVAV